MKYYELTKEEQLLLEEFEKGHFISDLDDARAKDLQKIAQHTLNKTKNINLRLSEKTVLKLKSKASAMGIPYQTLASSIIHQFANK